MKCLITDDHELIREGIRHLLETALHDIEVLETGNGHDVMGIMERHPDIAFIVLDFYMPGIDGLVLLKMIADTFPDVPVIVVSATENTILMRKILDAGASGFIPKSSANDDIINAIQLVLAGGIFVPPALVSASAVQDGNGACLGDRRGRDRGRPESGDQGSCYACHPHTSFSIVHATPAYKVYHDRRPPSRVLRPVRADPPC